MERESRLVAVVAELGFDLSAPIKVGGDYAPIIVHDGQAHVSGQIPRIGDVVAVTGRVGDEATLEAARHAAKIGIIRALALLRQALGSLDRVSRALHMTVYVQSAEGFTQQSEVADAASAVLHHVLGEAGIHARTSVGVFRLPKNAAVEISLTAAVD
ncbi:Enamine deaminase RidA, house cleaning of reactive enamine intermediates, YjgF/YER057c/UK114 family [Noviherbaspirillum humi]|uniref:Enamine deaminase RidA, house cleaning of reactive enamine intermediates, YjgF/YER057c/UK114 family n=1 Tax=Noviherbaspirillum humi TaxID=1688639 RepID=A0A239CMT4_9BURK|nr:RidA family protein [Noviherbaspirillum humi]SNS21249.1 Enamine deaminase RidA, house cleaning of reactive enamine intermediates, YjgF/YER057c/UK114 family [Noviherbaspirillum humi]